MAFESCSGRRTWCSLKTYASFCGCCKCLAARSSDQCFFAESLSVRGWYTSLKLAAAGKTSCINSEADSSKSKHMANSDRMWCCQKGTPNLGKSFSSNPDVPKGIFGVPCNHVSQQVLKEQHALDNWMYCCVIALIVAPCLCVQCFQGTKQQW